MHLTEDQLNEYLDYETADRAEIETHLDSCGECAARLAALQALFIELDSLPEVALTRNIAARFIPDRSRTPQLPGWLTLTASLQAALALTALAAAIPFVSAMLPRIEPPSFTTALFELQSLWTSWLDGLSTFQFPAIQPLPLPVMEMSTLLLVLAVVSIFWIFGNGLLLRNQTK